MAVHGPERSVERSTRDRGIGREGLPAKFGGVAGAREVGDGEGCNANILEEDETISDQR